TTHLNLRTTIQDVGDLLAQRAEEKHLEIVCAVPPDFPIHLRGDAGRLRQVLLNLMGNAIKFTEVGEVAVEVRLLSETTDEVCFRVSVIDTGIGIPAHRHGHVFESFTQVDVSTTRKYGGTGLGLAISRQLVELMGGRIGVESEPGNGSCFWFEVSLERDPH